MNKQISHLFLPVGWLCAALLVAVAEAQGQSQGQAPIPTPEPAPLLTPSFVRNQDYFRNVISLSETLGKAHAVRVVCNGRNDQYWRAYMQRLLELEAPYGGGLRGSMVDGFNAGFSVASGRHVVCDGEAVASEKTYAQTGKALTDSLAAANIPRGSGMVPEVVSEEALNGAVER